MRILMLAQNYPPTAGGEEQHVRNLSRELVRRGHDVAVVCLRDGTSPDETVDEGVRIYRVGGLMQRIPVLFSTGRRFAPPFPDPETTSALWRIIEKERPEVVHAHNWLVYAFLPLKRRSGAKLVLSLHDYSLICPQKRFMYHNQTVCSGPGVWKCLECASSYYGVAKGVMTAVAHRAMRPIELRAVDMFLPVSTSVATGCGLADGGLPWKVISNFTPDAYEAPSADDTPLRDALPAGEFILFVGDLSRDKGIHVLIDAFAGLGAEAGSADAPLQLVLIGRPSRETPTTLPPHVTLIPGLPHAAVMAAWRASLLGVVPSTCPEACPTVAFEAMASEKALICSRIGGLVDIVVDGETGLLTEPGNVDALRSALAQLITNPDLRARMGQAGKERAQLYRAAAVVPQIEAVYQTLVEQNAAVPSEAADHQRIAGAR